MSGIGGFGFFIALLLALHSVGAQASLLGRLETHQGNGDFQSLTPIPI